MLTKKLKSFLRRKMNFKIFEDSKNSKFQKNSKGSFVKKDVQCYTCKRFGHLSQNYSTPRESKKGDKKGKKVLNTTWDDDDVDSSGHDYCLNGEDNDNSSSWLLVTTVEKNETHNSHIEDKVGKKEEKDEEDDIQQPFEKLNELCENSTKG